MKDSAVNSSGEHSGTSLTLLERVRQHDQADWGRLVSLYSPLVCQWCLRYQLPAEEVEEIGQEVFLAVARTIHAFRHDRDGDTFRGWLWTITRNKILDRTVPVGGWATGGSDAQRRLQGLPDGDAEEADEQALAAERALLYRRAVELIESEFESTTRRAFWLALSGRRPADVAAEVGISTGAVYVAKSRVLKRLREEFGELLEPWAPSQLPTRTAEATTEGK